MKNRLTTVLASTLILLGASSVRAAPPAVPATDAPAQFRLGGLLAQSAIWPEYKAHFLRPEGRIVDTGNGGMSHSEGQGYGLLLAVAAADREAFDRILGWTNSHLFVRPDHLAAWRWNGAQSETSNENDAADGDILIAWALAEAADLWNEPAYVVLGRKIARDIAAELISPDLRFGLLLKPGAKGFSQSERPDGAVVNPSYWVFPAFARLKQLAPEADWSGVEASGVALIEASRFGNAHLPTDWVAMGREGPHAAEGFAGGFGYNALRTPLYAVWGGVETPGLMSALADASADPSESAGALANPGPLAIAAYREPGYAKIWALARCAAAGEAYPSDFYSFTAEQNYYPATLGALSLIAAAYRGGPCLDREAMTPVLGGVWPTLAHDISKMDSPPVRVAANEAAPKTVVTLPPAPDAAAAPSPADARPGAVVASALSPGFIAGALTLILCGAGAAFFAHRRRAAKARLETLFAPSPEAMTALAPSQALRSLPSNPFSETSSLATLGQQINSAATASVELGRTFGIIYFRLEDGAGPTGQTALSRTDDDVIELLARLRGALRKTDHVALINGDEIIACISLLPGLTELKTISDRLRRAGRESLRFGAAFEAPAGLSVYPLGGYEAEELIASARSRHRQEQIAAGLTPPGLPAPAPARKGAKSRPRKKKKEPESASR